MNLFIKKRLNELLRRSEIYFYFQPLSADVEKHYEEFCAIEDEIEKILADERLKREKEGRVEWGLINPPEFPLPANSY